MRILTLIKNSLLQSKREAVLGFDLGSHTIKCAELTKNRDKIILNGFTRVKTFENTIINQIINDSHLLRSNLKNLILNFKPKSNSAILSIPYEITIYGNFTIRNPEAIREIEKQINDEIPYNIDDVYYSYFILPEKDGYVVHYLVSKKENIDILIDVFTSLDLTIENIDADFINLHNFFELLYGPENRLIIDWGYEKVKLHFSTKDTPVYTRELFNLGTKNIKTKLQKELKVTPDLVEKFFLNPPNDDNREKIRKIVKEYIIKLADEIRFGIDIARSKYNLNPEKFYLIGGGARIPNINNILSKLTNVKIELVDIRKKLEISENIDPLYVDIINKQGIIAIASAVRKYL